MTAQGVSVDAVCLCINPSTSIQRYEQLHGEVALMKHSMLGVSMVGTYFPTRKPATKQAPHVQVICRVELHSKGHMPVSAA